MIGSGFIGVLLIAVLVGALVAALLLRHLKYLRDDKEHRRYNDERIAQGLPPITRKQFEGDDEF